MGVSLVLSLVIVLAVGRLTHSKGWMFVAAVTLIYIAWVNRRDNLW